MKQQRIDRRTFLGYGGALAAAGFVVDGLWTPPGRRTRAAPP